MSIPGHDYDPEELGREMAEVFRQKHLRGDDHTPAPAPVLDPARQVQLYNAALAESARRRVAAERERDEAIERAERLEDRLSTARENLRQLGGDLDAAGKA